VVPQTRFCSVNHLLVLQFPRFVSISSIM
jgi:hypothetical protein